METQFKVVIWGLGTNGKNLIDVLGEELVIAIIESNSEKVKMKFYNNIPIIDFEIYLKEFRKYYIVVTPMKYHVIEIKLKNNNIKNYIIQNRSKISLGVLWKIRENKFIDEYKINQEKEYVIGGFNLFSILLYKYLKDNDIKVSLCCGNYEGSIETDRLVKCNIISESCDRLPKKRRMCFIQTEEYPCQILNGIEIIDYKKLNTIAYLQWKKDIKKFYNCHKGKRIFIVATGPSLRIADLEKLYEHQEITISMNYIYYIFSNTKWRPDYYVASDGNMIRAYESLKSPELWFEKTEKFFSDNYLKFWEKKRDNTYHCYKQEQNPDRIEFSSDFSEVVYSGLTVTYTCLQLAVYMGAKEIYLLGTDFCFSKNFNSQNDHFYGKGDKWYTFDYDFVQKAYEVAKSYAESNRIKIYNATHGGMLEVFERVDFESLF